MRGTTGPAAIAAAGVLVVYGAMASAADAPPVPTIPLQLDLASNDAAPPAQSDTALLDSSSGDAAGGDFLGDWFARVEQAQASQPHWMTPLVTVTPRLEQEIRYDQYWEYRGNGSDLDIFDSGKGLELIPTTTNEVLINPPAYQEKLNVAHPVAGWLDDQFLVVKQRLVSANEEDGNYIVSAFLGVTAPSGYSGFTNGTWIVTPTLAAAKAGAPSTSRRPRAWRFLSGINRRSARRSRPMSHSSTMCLNISGRNSRSTTRTGRTGTKEAARTRCC